MLDIFNHLAVFAALTSVICISVIDHLNSDPFIEWFKSCSQIFLIFVTIGEILAWSIWYLSGAVA